MRLYEGKDRLSKCLGLIAFVAVLSGVVNAAAQAGTPPERPEPPTETTTAGAPPQPGPPEPDAAPKPAPPAAPAPVPAPAPVTLPGGPPPVSLIPDGEAPKGPIPPAPAPAIPNIDFGARLQTALLFQDPDHPKRMNDIGAVVTADILTSGQIHRYLKWQANITMSYAGTAGSPSSVNVQPLDLIARIEPMPELNVYVGRMLVVADRFAPSGPWGMDEFFFPGFFPLIGAPAMPKAGPVGRDVGVTVWGAPFAGHFKYYAAAFNLYNPALNPLLTGRLQVSLLSGEPAFYHRTTYFGTKDLISVGVGGQYQKNGSIQNVPVTTPPTIPLTDNYSNITADLTAEKNFAGIGTVSLVGAYYKYNGSYQRWKDLWVASLGYMLPNVVGIGKIRATVRYQRGMDMTAGADASSLLDAQLSYNIAAWFARFQLGYRHGETYLAPTGMTPARLQPNNMAYLGITLADP